jgi:hypothetical protein
MRHAQIRRMSARRISCAFADGSILIKSIWAHRVARRTAGGTAAGSILDTQRLMPDAHQVFWGRETSDGRKWGNLDLVTCSSRAIGSMVKVSSPIKDQRKRAVNLTLENE